MSTLKDDGIILGRRQHERFAVEVDAELVSEHGTFGVVTRDLSRGGICCVAPQALPVGTSFQISLSLVLGENAFSEPLVLSGVVIWCTALGAEYQIGASFEDLGSETREYLLLFLNFLAEGLRLEEGEEEDQEDEDEDEEKGLFA